MDTLCIPTVMYNSLKQVQKLQSYNPVIISNTGDRYMESLHVVRRNCKIKLAKLHIYVKNL